MRRFLFNTNVHAEGVVLRYKIPVSKQMHEFYWQLPSGLAAASLFSWLTVRRGSLTLDGAAAASCCGLWALFFAGPLWLLPLFFFFISSILL